jgi:hypothetical protein
MHLITQPVNVTPSTNLVMTGANWTKRVLYHDTAAQTITEPPMCLTLKPNQAFRIVGFLVCSTNVNSS